MDDTLDGHMEYMRHKHRADGLIELHRRHIEEMEQT